MKITFTGVPGEDLDQITMYGITFPKGKGVEVTDPLAANVLSNHAHFNSASTEPLKAFVLPQTIPSVESTALISDGHATVTEHERNAINADPRMLPGAQVSYEQILDAKEGDGNDLRAGTTSAAQTDGARPGRKRK